MIKSRFDQMLFSLSVVSIKCRFLSSVVVPYLHLQSVIPKMGSNEIPKKFHELQLIMYAFVGSVVEWLDCRDCDRHGLGSKPTRPILLCS